MTKYEGVVELGRGKRLALTVAGAAAVLAPVFLGFLGLPAVRAQAVPDWQTAAGGKMAFEVASIKLDNGPFHSPNFPLDNGSAYTPGDRLSADFPLLTYIQFAYKVRFSQQQRDSILDRGRLPRWIISDRYAIEAKAASRVTKDQMRLMMQSMLADRFHVAAHFETQETAVMALTLANPGKTGPKLRPHSEGPPCDDSASSAQSRTGGPAVFPQRCYAQEATSNGQQIHAGSRDTTMAQLAEALSSLSRLDRPVVDQTGLSGGIDYEIEWTRESDGAPPPGGNPSPEPSPTFLEALREQLGLKFEAVKAPLQVLVIDHVERPAEN